MSPPLPRVFLPPIIIFSLLILSMLLFTLWYQRRRALNAPDPSTIQREIELSDTSQGSQVWFSRQIHRGTWTSWSLIIRNRRYQLHQSTHANGALGPLYFESTSCSLPHERQQAEADRGFMAGYKGFYCCLIGWTRLKDEDIARAGDKVVSGLGDDVWEGNVQDFVRGLAERVCETRKASDWGWFKDNVTCHWKEVEVRLMAGPNMGRRTGVRPRSVMPWQAGSVDAGVRDWAYG